MPFTKGSDTMGPGALKSLLFRAPGPIAHKPAQPDTVNQKEAFRLAHAGHDESKRNVPTDSRKIRKAKREEV